MGTTANRVMVQNHFRRLIIGRNVFTFESFVEASHFILVGGGRDIN